MQLKNDVVGVPSEKAAIELHPGWNANNPLAIFIFSFRVVIPVPGIGQSRGRFQSHRRS
jgi:hypothetical protein